MVLLVIFYTSDVKNILLQTSSIPSVEHSENAAAQCNASRLSAPPLVSSSSEQSILTYIQYTKTIDSFFKKSYLMKVLQILVSTRAYATICRFFQAGSMRYDRFKVVEKYSG
jgi:hypothetical protein